MIGKPTVNEVVALVVRLEDDPQRRTLLDGAPYELFRAAVDEGIVERTSQNAFAGAVGEAYRRQLLGFTRESAGAKLPPPDSPWTDGAFQARSGYFSTVDGRQLAALLDSTMISSGTPGQGASRRDVFISHAGEDKDAVARPLAEAFHRRDKTVWFDEYELVLGDSLRQRIDDGLRHAQVGLVILSPHFFAKPWTQYELDGLTARQIAGDPNVIIPVWHEVTINDVRHYAPSLAGLVSARSTDGADVIVDGVCRVLERIAAGDQPEARLVESDLRSASAINDQNDSLRQPVPAQEQGARSIPERVQPFVLALSDPDEDVRYEAMSALHDRLTPNLLPIIEPLLEDPDKFIRSMAVDYYARLSGPDGTPRIIDALSDPNGDVRFEAMSALHDRLTPDLLPTIESLFKDPDKFIRSMALDYYGQLTA